MNKTLLVLMTILVVGAGACAGSRRSGARATRPVRLAAVNPLPRNPEVTAYLHSLKLKINEAWNPLKAWKDNDPEGEQYGEDDRQTVVRVTLGYTGKLEKIEVAEGSGAGFLDEEALGAFKRSAPYTPPPKAMLGLDGTTTFDFGFNSTYKALSEL